MISISIVMPASTSLRERGMDMETYRQMQTRHQKEMNDFPIAFAYDEKQFNDGMNKLGLDPSETDKVVSVFYGAFIRKEDHPALMEMFERHTREERDAFVRNEDVGHIMLSGMNWPTMNSVTPTIMSQPWKPAGSPWKS